jgi:hypothetical protein
MGRYIDLLGGQYTGFRGAARTRFADRMIADASAVTDDELATLLASGWRTRITAAWLIGVDLRTSYRARLGELLLDSEVCFAGRGYCFALARFGTHEDAGILTSYLERYLPRTDLHYDQDVALGALLHIDARLGTAHAARFTVPGGPWDRWAATLPPPGDGTVRTPAGEREWIDQLCGFAGGWSRPA